MVKRIPRLHDNQKPARSIYTQLVDVPRNANEGLHSASGAFVESMLGKPDSVKTLKLTKVVDLGPFVVEGLIPAVESLSDVMSVVRDMHPDLYCRLSPNGMRVVKKIAGTSSRSLHSWGIAIDLKVDAIEDVKWNDKAFYGLALMAPIFHSHQWFWGGAFREKETKKGSGIYVSNEDAMHFEVSKEKLLEWQRSGIFGPISKSRQETIQPAGLGAVNTASSSDQRILHKGDKGPSVVLLQNALNLRNYKLVADGRFGSKTESALIDFQRKHGLIPNGIVGKRTAFYLALF